MKKVKFLYDKVMEITGQVGKDHVGAYAALKGSVKADGDVKPSRKQRGKKHG